MFRRTVRFRTTTTAVAIVGAALLVSAAFLLVLVDRALTANVDRQARLRALEVTALVRDGKLPATLAGEDDGTVAQVMADDGRILSQSPIIHGISALAPVVPTSDEITVRTVLRPAVGDGSDTYRVASTRVDTPDGPVVVYAGASLEPVEDTMQVLRLLLAVMVPLLILVVGLTTWRLVGRTLEPVEAIRRQVAEISAAALDRRVPEPATADEVQRLALTMNAMLDRLDAAARRQRTFVSDASHELRSPLATIRTKLEVALRSPTPDWPRLVRECLTEQARLEGLVTDLLVLARLDEHPPVPPPPPIGQPSPPLSSPASSSASAMASSSASSWALTPRTSPASSPPASPVSSSTLSGAASSASSSTPSPAASSANSPAASLANSPVSRWMATSVVDVDELVLSEARNLHSRGRIRIDVTAVAGGRVRGDPTHLRRVVANLLDNAERHATSTVRCALSTNDHTVELTVTDDGPGIPPADRHRVFDRFVRLDESRTQTAGGAGLGLAIVREVVTAHGGTVEIQDAAPGAQFVVHLPAHVEPHSRAVTS